MNDYVKIRGHFKIESINSQGEVIDVFEKHNLITNVARNTFAKLLAGISNVSTINRFVIGTKGHVDTDVLHPKDSTTGFDATRTNLFCGTQDSEKNVTWNELKFVPSGNINVTAASNVTDGASNNSTVNIQVTGLDIAEPTVTYTFNIAQDAFNGTDGIIYTECGLFADDTLIAMRTFKGKVKENTVSFRITWNIIF
jgi:hypothetical protein|nr:MAG TPA: hypothetical protein [Caudoviricetes sp.]